MPTSQILLGVEWKTMSKLQRNGCPIISIRYCTFLSYNLWDVAEPAGQTTDEETKTVRVKCLACGSTAVKTSGLLTTTEHRMKLPQRIQEFQTFFRYLTLERSKMTRRRNPSCHLRGEGEALSQGPCELQQPIANWTRSSCTDKSRFPAPQHPRFLGKCLGCFALQQQSWAIAIETTWCAKSKVCTICHFRIR